jgi:site-specific recombinase XerD
MTDLKEILKEKRPNLSKTSLNTYTSTLTNLHKKVFKDTPFDIENFNKTQEILNFLKDIPPNKRKSILASLVVISDKKEYRDIMLEDIKEYNKETAKQKKTANQEESWVSQEDIDKKHKEMEGKWKLLLKKERYVLSQKEIQEMQDFVMLSLLGGIYIPPRRLKDYVDFRLRPIGTEEPTTVNTRSKNKLIFNSYKTAKTYGQQIVKMPPKLGDIMNKWTNTNPTFYLFIDTKGKPLTNVKMNQRLNKIFGKKVSVNQLRHSYLSHKYADRLQANEELAKDFEDMGSSMHQEKVYIKNTSDNNNNDQV